MTHCPFCEAKLNKHQSTCPACHAKRGYLTIDNVVFGKSALIFIGLVMPFFTMMFGISAQNELGVAVSIAMIIPIMFTMFKLFFGQKWFISS